ncbi:hypothetical protein ACHAQJ_003317 [Trichoderma viride]
MAAKLLSTEPPSIGRLPIGMNPNEYANAVKAFSVLPRGSNYLSLGRFLADDNDDDSIVQIDEVKVASVALMYSLGPSTTDCHIFQSPTKLHEFQSETNSCIVFLRGFLSAAWINNIGCRYLTDPEFFGRHLDFRSWQDKNNNFSIPSLPAASWHLMELPITTIGSRESNLERMSPSAWIDKARRKGRIALEVHHDRLSRLSSDIVVGESMIRDYYVFDEVHFAIDQRISICMQQVEDGNPEDDKKMFKLIVWTDAGTGASTRPLDPWDAESLKSQHHPIIDNKPMIALKGHLFQSPGATNTEPSTLQDSLSQLLLRDYGRSLHRETKALDPFYALGEIFQFSANSQQQFLNTVDAKVRIYTAKGSEHDDEILPHLKYTQQILYSRISDIKRILRSIENTARPAWTKSSCETGRQKADIARKAIQRDFEDLLDHAVSLYDRTKEAITVLHSSISITESHLASLQADKAGKLTFLASAFVPVSVATGIFGMNVRELPGDEISIFWFFVVVVVLATLIFILFYFNGRRKRDQE